MALADFEALLRDAIGLDARSIGVEAIVRAVQTRQLACDMLDPDEYWRHAWASETERQELIEAVVVPETWFFRDRAAFTALAHVVRNEWLPSRGGDMFRVLSLPCSTGEEPYSIAMTLFDAGVTPGRFQIDAGDISVRALERATRAVYGKNSFRGDDLSFRDRYFDETDGGYSVSDRVRRQIRFDRGNLFTAPLVPGAAGSYDAVFCRNLLIYFDRETQTRAVRLLEQLLKPSGVLFVAPSETALPLEHNFESLRVPQSFGFRRVSSTRRDTSPARPAPVVHGQRRLTAVPPRAAARPQPISESSRAEAEPAISISLDDAARLADQGLFADAIALCDAHIRQSGPSAGAFRLLGVVRDACGEAAEAAACYRKALYLDPNQLDVMMHLALLMDRLNRPHDAQVLRNRIRRLEQKGA